MGFNIKKLFPASGRKNKASESYVKTLKGNKISSEARELL